MRPVCSETTPHMVDNIVRRSFIASGSMAVPPVVDDAVGSWPPPGPPPTLLPPAAAAVSQAPPAPLLPAPPVFD